ncbi:hypothetical protein BKA83DRAFT_4166812 [Pisolithus microcarpus]|nr:hypothetical protein BKA83DRAFT_4166812 [Pisolithus microcarpus]
MLLVWGVTLGSGGNILVCACCAGQLINLICLPFTWICVIVGDIVRVGVLGHATMIQDSTLVVLGILC